MISKHTPTKCHPELTICKFVCVGSIKFCTICRFNLRSWSRIHFISPSSKLMSEFLPSPAFSSLQNISRTSICLSIVWSRYFQKTSPSQIFWASSAVVSAITRAFYTPPPLFSPIYLAGNVGRYNILAI